MSLFEAIVLGIIQGLTEFLPVSSSGHLELAKAIFGGNSLPKESMAFTILLHGATALSTIAVYRKDIGQIIAGLFNKDWNEEKIFSVKIIISMIPAALVGVLFNDQLEVMFSGQTLWVGILLLLTGGLLLTADRAKSTEKPVTFMSSLIIGISQAIAILPGISRSGATISTAVILGIDKEKAARFSFLMVVPLILGKMAKDILDGGSDFGSLSIPVLSGGFIAAFVAGILACTWMIALVKKSQLKYFAYYCFLVGMIAVGINLM
ncbi:MAG: undecaprenyl-diphosphate phosphatase [Salibacteraceae bacterium]